MSWSGSIWWAREELNLRPLPRQQTTGNRCADGPLSVRRPPVNGDRLIWLRPPSLRGGVAAPNRSRGQGGAPAATRGRTTLASARTGACLADRGGWSTSVQAVHPLAMVVVIGSCVRAPSLIWVRGPSGSGDKMIDGVSPVVRGRAVFWGRPRTGRGGRGLAGAGRGTSACLWAGHAPAILVRPPLAGAGPRPGRARRRRAQAGCAAPAGRACAPPPGSPGCRPGGP
jgi:hypothetical protein